MTGRSGVPNWILETFLWLDERDLLEILLVVDRWEKDYYEVISKSLMESQYLS